MTDEPSSDEQLIVDYHGCNDIAFAELYRRWFPRLVRYFRQLLFDRDLAEDLAHEVFVRVVQTKVTGRSRFDPARGQSFTAWLFTIARHLFQDYLRHRSHRPQLTTGEVGDAGAPSPIESAVAKGLPVSDILAFNECLGRLDPEYRVVYELRRILGHSGKETADLLGIPEGTVASRLFRAEAQMRACLGDD